MAANRPECRLSELNRLACFDHVLIQHRGTGEELFLREGEAVDERKKYLVDVRVGGRPLETIYANTEIRLNAGRVALAPGGVQHAARECSRKQRPMVRRGVCSRAI